MIRFDPQGVCSSPASLAHLLDASREATDVFLFSHGWNNDWAAATRNYTRFIDEFNQQYAAQWHPPGRDYRPVLVGVHWPSTSLVLPSERGPRIAGEPEADVAGGVEELRVDLLAQHLDADGAARVYDLADRPEISLSEATELAVLIAPALAGHDDEVPGGDGPDSVPDPEELVRLWAAMPPAEEPAPGERGGFVPDAPGGQQTPETAGLLDRLNPRNIIRSATVLLMKDRAGRVGGAGVRTMLHGILGAATDSRVHLVGHSYGGKVVLSALAHGAAPARPVESVLLLQPATSAKCFADPGDGKPAGGYRPALDRTRQPLMTTFSSHDVPLTKLFHFAARRASDTREAVIAGGLSEYAALGGFGPQDTSSVTVVDALTAPQRYDLPDTRLLAVRSDEVISGHGDVQNPATAWALLCQVME
ncbi:alpha/beta fold hydrolase [Ornithinimicrobium cavernae]|uniref:alpha/beta fold hydrolase n=1 Tax=Ornithinimicrobium cavernae TaxID=2666047 RepID=UPI0012B16904|nr:hypothetical protein [Ornithinimicrobium cavernae]